MRGRLGAARNVVGGQNRDDEGEKLGSLSWSATSRLKEQIRETAHPRTLTQPRSKSSRVPLDRGKPNPANIQTNNQMRLPTDITTPNLPVLKLIFYPLKNTTQTHNHKKVHVLDSSARRVFHEMTPVILKSYVIISK